MVLLVKTGKTLDQFDLKVNVKNLLTAPDTYLTTNLNCNKTGIIKDKKQIK